MMGESSLQKSETEHAEPLEREGEASALLQKNLPYTADEMSQITAHLDDPTRDTAASSSSWEKSTLPLLLVLVEKVLQLAAESCAGAGDSAAATPSRSSGWQKEQFTEENDYLLEQLRLQQEPFFTLPRLWEVLKDPYQYHCNEAGKLRGGKLQTTLRRLILVSAPPIPSVTTTSVA